jgi:hypothetical protein
MNLGWKLDNESWEALLQLALRLKLTWQRCPLRADSRHLVPELPGVYAIEIPAPFQLATTEHIRQKQVMPIRSPIYIGESSSNIRNRFANHTGPHAQDRILAARRLALPEGLQGWFIWSTIPNYSDAQALESLLIDCFRPPCNKIGGVKLLQGIPAGSMKLH